MFKMAVRIAYRIEGRCPRHRAYNPAKDEQAGIKGGCQECYGLFQAYRACLTLREAIGAFETTVHSFITNKQARGRCGDQRAFVPEAPLRLARRRSQEDGDAIAPEVLCEPGE